MNGVAGLACPRCGGAFTGGDAGPRCGDCGSQWREVDHVLVPPGFDEAHYWGEIPRAQMLHLLARSEAVGPVHALEEWATDAARETILRYALDWRRALFLELVDVPDAAVVLDYGAGWGTLGIAAARDARQVFLADSAIDRARFALRLARELEHANVTAIAVHNWGSLPLPAGSVDLVILNGVVEWVAVGAPGDARGVQGRFLRHMWDLLRPGGSLFIGIENRFALRYVRGYPDDHSALRFTSLMPRALADRYSRLRSGDRYRTLTWSLREWRRLATELPAATCRIYSMWPDYRFPLAACDVGHTAALAGLRGSESGGGRGRQLALAALERSGLGPGTAYSFGVVLAKGGGGQT